MLFWTVCCEGTHTLLMDSMVTQQPGWTNTEFESISRFRRFFISGPTNTCVFFHVPGYRRLLFTLLWLDGVGNKYSRRFQPLYSNANFNDILRFKKKPGCSYRLSTVQRNLASKSGSLNNYEYTFCKRNEVRKSKLIKKKNPTEKATLCSLWSINIHFETKI